MIARAPSGCEAWLPTLRNRPNDRPFFLWLAALDPHREYEDGALDPPHRLTDIVVPPHLPDVPAVREDLRLYYDEIGRLDTYVGRVVAELDRQGVAGNTLILFISDNGRPFPRDKTTLYDGGIRTPWIVRWPDRVAAGGVTDSLVSAVDIAPTFLRAADLPSPATFEGVSFLPVLDDPEVSVRDHVFAEDHWHDYEDHGRSIGNQRWKLIRNDYPDLPATPSADAGRSPTWQTMLSMRREHLLFAHWPVRPESLHRHIPADLELDLFDGFAWIGIVPFVMRNTRVRGLPPLPGVATFPELNVRTYVNHRRQGKPGVWFFSLDAANRMAVRTARTVFHLPYFDARMSAREVDGAGVLYESDRVHRNAPGAAFRAEYRPVSTPWQADRGTLDHWLTERYCLYSADSRGRIYRGDIHHVQWPLQRAEAVVPLNTMTEPLGVRLTGEPASLVFARRLDVAAWLIQRV